MTTENFLRQIVTNFQERKSLKLINKQKIARNHVVIRYSLNLVGKYVITMVCVCVFIAAHQLMWL